MTRLIIITLVTVIFLSCNNENTASKSDENNDSISKKETIEKVVKKEVKLIDIPAKINEETKRYLHSKGILAIDVFNANLAMNKGQEILEKMFSNTKITPADATETFDSFNIISDKEKFNAVIIYEQNKNEEFVIHTIYISKGLFSFDILDKIFS